MKIIGKILYWAFLLFGFAMLFKGLYLSGLQFTLFGLLPIFAAIYSVPRQKINVANLAKLLLLFFTALMAYLSIGFLILDGEIIISKILIDALILTGMLAVFVVISGQLQKKQIS